MRLPLSRQGDMRDVRRQGHCTYTSEQDGGVVPRLPEVDVSTKLLRRLKSPTFVAALADKRRILELEEKLRDRERRIRLARDLLPLVGAFADEYQKAAAVLDLRRPLRRRTS